jgi:putative YphP/YqiW family bacilliredoxin
MRLELTRLGVEELRTAADVELALQHHARPDRVATVFAGAEIEATDHARSYFAGYPPSSPSVALLRDGQLMFMLERAQIENRTAEQIAATLTAAFDRFCGKPIRV